jgi:hypothetical protein
VSNAPLFDLVATHLSSSVRPVTVIHTSAHISHLSYCTIIQVSLGTSRLVLGEDTTNLYTGWNFERRLTTQSTSFWPWPTREWTRSQSYCPVGRISWSTRAGGLGTNPNSSQLPILIRKVVRLDVQGLQATCVQNLKTNPGANTDSSPQPLQIRMDQRL